MKSVARHYYTTFVAFFITFWSAYSLASVNSFFDMGYEDLDCLSEEEMKALQEHNRTETITEFSGCFLDFLTEIKVV